MIKQLSSLEKNGHKERFALTDRDAALRIVEKLRQNPNASKSDLVRQLQEEMRNAAAGVVQNAGAGTRNAGTRTGPPPSVPSAEKFASSLELASRLLLTIAIDSSQPDVHSRCLPWPNDKSLKDAVAAEFKTQTAFPTERRDIPPGISMANICDRHGYTVRWTDNLMEHLQIDVEAKRIMFYEHLFCLKHHLESRDPAEEFILPKAIIEEAIDSFVLLFRPSDRRTREFLDGQRPPRDFYELGTCGRQRCLNLASYRRWGPNIERLIAVMNEPEEGLQKNLLGRRFGVVEKCVALYVAVLTVIATGLAIYATILAKNSLDVAGRQFKFDVAKECLDADVAKALPQFCGTQ